MIQTVKTLDDPYLGEILFRKNIRARKYIIRIKQNAVTVTIPYGGTYKEAEKFFDKNKALVLKKKAELNAKAATAPASAPNDALLRLQAQSFLPEKLADLAGSHGFIYQTVKIRKSKTRWGSCSSKGNISLSFYLLLLPQHLIEYVLLHELCHTVQMNHSPAFWALLDKHTQGRAKELRKEIKKYKIP
jgi:predicted metal-dependent hydrolase